MGADVEVIGGARLSQPQQPRMQHQRTSSSKTHAPELLNALRLRQPRSGRESAVRACPVSSLRSRSETLILRAFSMYAV